MRVRFHGVEKRYGDFYAVRDLNLEIKPGALHFLLGPSGCGKTTTLRMLAGLETPTGGKIFFDDRDVTNLPAAERGIGMVFQNYALWPHMTVRKNVEYGLKLRKLTAVEIKRRIDEVLEFTQLHNFAERLPGQLSGGQQQRVALARALAIRPNVLLLDEPLSNLDAKLRLEMRDNISRIHKQTGITTVYVTHDQKEALSMGSHVSVMHAGKLIQTGSPRELYHSPENTFIAGFIGETNIIEGTYAGFADNNHMVKTDVGELRAARAMGTWKPGDKVSLSVRPEAMRPSLGGVQGSGNRLELKLDHLTYLGESEQLQLKTPSTMVKASIFNPPEHTTREGDTVTCWIAPDDLLVLPAPVAMGPRT